MKNCAVIVKTRSKNQPFRVRYIGKNGEILAVSECLTTKWNCRKNMLALMGLVAGWRILVYDTAGAKKEKYFLYASGEKTPAEIDGVFSVNQF